MVALILIAAAVAVIAVVAWSLSRGGQEGAHACEFCDRSFDSAHDLESHLLEHGRIERPTLAP